MIALCQVPASQPGQAELVGVARPCNLLSWSFQIPQPASPQTTAAAPARAPTADSANAQSAWPGPTSDHAGKLLSASFSAGAQQLLLAFADSWHVLQRSAEGGLAYTASTRGGACFSAPAGGLAELPSSRGDSRQEGYAAAGPAWQGGLLHPLPGSGQLLVVMWDTRGSLRVTQPQQGESEPAAAQHMQIHPAWGSISCQLTSLPDGGIAAVASQFLIGRQAQAVTGPLSAPAAVLVPASRISTAASGSPAALPPAPQTAEEQQAVSSIAADSAQGLEAHHRMEEHIQCSASLVIDTGWSQLLAQAGPSPCSHGKLFILGAWWHGGPHAMSQPQLQGCNGLWLYSSDLPPANEVACCAGLQQRCCAPHAPGLCSLPCQPVARQGSSRARQPFKLHPPPSHSPGSCDLLGRLPLQGCAPGRA